MVEVPDHDVVHGVSSLQFMGPLKFAPVRAVAVLRGVSGRHRIPGGMAARRTDVLQGVPTAGPALLQDASPRSFRWNFASPPFAVSALMTRFAAFSISSSAVL